MRDKPRAALSLKAENTGCSVIFPACVRASVVVIILDVPVTAKCLLKFSTNEVCSARALFSKQERDGRTGGRKNILPFYKVKRLQMGRISRFDLLSITGSVQ